MVGFVTYVVRVRGENSPPARLELVMMLLSHRNSTNSFCVIVLHFLFTMSSPPPKGPQSFPYDHLFKLLMIGDAAVGKVSTLTMLWC